MASRPQRKNTEYTEYKNRREMWEIYMNNKWPDLRLRYPNWQRILYPSLIEDKDFVLDYLKQPVYGSISHSVGVDPLYLIIKSRSGMQWSDDKEVVLAAINCDPLRLQYASKRLKGDKEVVLAAIRRNADALKYASKDLRKNLFFLSDAIRINPNVSKFVSKKVRRAINEASLRVLSKLTAATSHAEFPLGKKGHLPLGHISKFLIHRGRSQFITIPKIGKRKIRYYKNGKPYVIIKGKKVRI